MASLLDPFICCHGLASLPSTRTLKGTLSHASNAKSKSNIILNAHRVNEGKKLEIVDDENHIKDLELYYVSNMEMMKTILFKKLEEEIKKSSMREFFLSSQILTPTKKGILGTENLNKEIQEIYNTYEKQKFKTFRKSRNKRKR